MEIEIELPKLCFYQPFWGNHTLENENCSQEKFVTFSLEWQEVELSLFLPSMCQFTVLVYSQDWQFHQSTASGHILPNNFHQISCLSQNMFVQFWFCSEERKKHHL